MAISAHLLAGSLKTSWKQNCLCMQDSFAIAQLEQRPLQSAGKRSDSGCLLHHQPRATVAFSYCTYSCSEHQQVGNNLQISDKGESVGV